jgi:hypothetical protein
MELITMNCAYNEKVIIDLNELQNNKRLQGARIFKRLFNIDNEGFQEEKINIELFKNYKITDNEWYSFLNFIRNGRIKYHTSLQYVELEEERKKFQKMFIEELDNQCSTGIFLKFGPFPIFDKYVKTSIQRHLDNMIYNPMTPQQDTHHVYNWTSGDISPNHNGWDVTVSLPFSRREKYYRRVKQS